MPATRTFSYEAIDGTGAVVTGKVESETSDGAAQALVNQRLIPLEVVGEGTGLNKELHIPGLGGRTSLKDLAVFANQFASMMGAGLTLLRALAILEEQTSRPKLKAALVEVRTEVERGANLSTAMSAHPDQFPLLMVNMIQAGEAGGFLDDALARIARMYEADANLRAKIKSALTYPIIVLIFSLLMGTGVILFIVPIFEKMFKQLGGKLPLPTQIMVNLSHNMAWILPATIVLVLGGLKTYRTAYRDNDSFRLKADTVKLRLPVFGALFTKLAISRWARNLGTLLGVGVPIIQGTRHRRRHGRQRPDRRGDARGARLGADGRADVHPAGEEPALSRNGRADAPGGRGDRSDHRHARQGGRLLRPGGRDRHRGTDLGPGALAHGAHGCRHRHDGRLPLPADVHHLPAHPEQLSPQARNTRAPGLLMQARRVLLCVGSRFIESTTVAIFTSPVIKS